jgi:DNA-binding IscR family transcriptional regulator
MQNLLETEFRDAEQAMEERLGRTTIAHLVQQVLASERASAQQNR